MKEYEESPICATLENAVTVPGENHEPNQLTVFRATERSRLDRVTRFYGLNVGPPNTVLEVSNENIRSVVLLGSYDK